MQLLSPSSSGKEPRLVVQNGRHDGSKQVRPGIHTFVDQSREQHEEESMSYKLRFMFETDEMHEIIMQRNRLAHTSNPYVAHDSTEVQASVHDHATLTRRLAPIWLVGNQPQPNPQYCTNNPLTHRSTPHRQPSSCL